MAQLMGAAPHGMFGLAPPSEVFVSTSAGALALTPHE